MEWLSRCLESIKNSTVKLNAIIIDNASVDGTQAFIKKTYSEFDLIESESNLGFGAANNIGIKKAFEQGADSVFLLNQDAWLQPYTISELILLAEQNKDYFVLSPLHIEADGERLDGNFINYLHKSKENNMLSDFILSKPKKKIYKVGFINAAAWLVTRECYEKIGLFDGVFFHYGEDVNYCQRINYHGGKIGVVPSVKVVHDRNTYAKKKAQKLDSKVNYRKLLLVVANVNNSNFKRDFNKFLLKNLLMSVVSLLNAEKRKYYFRSFVIAFKAKNKIYNSRVKNKKQPFF